MFSHFVNLTAEQFLFLPLFESTNIGKIIRVNINLFSSYDFL